MDGKLTKTELKTLAHCEEAIEQGLDQFFRVGQALWDIRDGRLYRASYETFEGYCAERWDFSRQWAYQLITAAKAVSEMSTMVDTPPKRERHVRPLLNVPEDHRADVWRMAVESAPKDEAGRPMMTAAIVQGAVDKWHDGRKAVVSETNEPPEAQVIDVDGRPVEPAGNQYLNEIPAEEGAPETCPECGSAEIDEDENGRYCHKCKAPIEDYPPAGDESGDQAEESEEDAWIRTIEGSLRELFAGRLAIGCARLEILIVKVRAEL